MKRIALILSVLLAAAGVADAQDTIRYPDTNYMYQPIILDSTYCGLIYTENWWVGHIASLPSYGFVEKNVYNCYYPDHQTLIYGIAVTGLTTPEDFAKEYGYPPPGEYDLYAVLIKRDNDTLYHVDSVLWQDGYRPGRYFVYPQMSEGILPDTVVPSYELYFDTPIPVYDSFFIGMFIRNFDTLYFDNIPKPQLACLCGRLCQNHRNNLLYYKNPPFYLHTYMDPYWGGFFPILTPQDTTRCDPVWDLQMTNATDTSVTLEWDGGNATQWEVEYAEADGMTAYSVVTTTTRVTLTGLRPTTTYLAHVRAWCARDTAYGGWTPFIEARTTAHQPDTDTVQNPDTVSIDAVGLFTRLMPNPASGIVTVQSSYSLNHVAVYDVQGHLVLEQKAVGTAATFDVGSLPKGVYVVSVRTTAGTTTKRLIVE